MMSKNLFKDIIPSLLEKREHELETQLDEKDYNAFVINRALSHHIDCIFHVANMNLFHDLDSRMQYDYYFHGIKKYKRKYQKWYKVTENKDIDVVKQYYDCSSKKAKEILGLLNEEQLNIIREKLDIGGKAKQ